MSCAETIIGSIGGVLAIGGLLTAFWGGGIRFREMNWRVGLGLASSGVGLFMLIIALPQQYANGFTVLATLTLAFAALMAIKQTREQEQHRREDQTNREKREKRERLTQEILRWAIEVNNFALRHRTEAVEQQLEDSFREFLDSQLISLFDQFEPFRSRSVYMAEITPAIDAQLKSGVESLIGTLKTQIADLHKYRRDKNTLAEDERARELARTVAGNNSNIHNKAVELIKQIAKSDVADL